MEEEANVPARPDHRLPRPDAGSGFRRRRTGRMAALGLYGALLLPIATPCLAKEYVVEVKATAGPWDAVVNREKMPFGSGDQAPPAILPFDLGGGDIAIWSDGSTSIPGKAGVGAGGIDGDEVDDKLARKKRYPSFYSPKLLYPVNRHALIAVFLDGQGKVISRAIPVGDGIKIPIPVDAAALAFGFNDVDFSKNTGSLKVTVDLPE